MYLLLSIFPCLDIHDTFVSWVGSGGADSGGGSQQPVAGVVVVLVAVYSSGLHWSSLPWAAPVVHHPAWWVATPSL